LATRLLFASNFYLYTFPNQPKPPYHHVHGYECLWVIPVHRFWVVFLPVSRSHQLFSLSVYQLCIASPTDSIIKSLRSRRCITRLLSIPWGALRTSRFILKGTPLIISWFTSSLICVFRHWNDVKLSYDSQTYSAEPLGTLDLNLEHQLPEDDVLYGPHYHNTLHLPSTPTLQYFPQALDSRYEEEDGSNPPLGDSDWNGIVDGFQRGIYDAPHPFIPPTNQSIEESTATVSVPLVNATSEVPGQDIFVGFKEEEEEIPLSMLWDGGRSLDDFPQELLSSEYEDHPSPPTQEALVSSAPQQPGISGGNDLGIAFAHSGTADMGIMSMGSQRIRLTEASNFISKRAPPQYTPDHCRQSTYFPNLFCRLSSTVVWSSQTTI
jgi:hypothetical protein